MTSRRMKSSIENATIMNNQILNVAIIIGSTRPNRNGEAVGKWIYEIAKKRNDANFELLDIKDYNLPLLDEPIPPSMGQYTKEHTKTWSLKIDSFDAYIFVTAEYNHGIPGALKNAIDFLYKEWNNKVAGFVSYGGAGGVRSVEQLRLVMAELKVATARSQVTISLFTDFENFTKFKPASFQDNSAKAMLDDVIAWGGALKTLRTDSSQDLQR
jgi:NAD(P)H-dependent FMN reductase